MDLRIQYSSNEKTPTAFDAFAGRAAGAALGRAQAAGGLDALGRTAAAAERRVRIVRRTVRYPRVRLRLVLVLLAVGAVLGAVAERHRSYLTRSTCGYSNAVFHDFFDNKNWGDFIVIRVHSDVVRKPFSKYEIGSL